MTIKDEEEPFLSRWSRLKQDARSEPAAPSAPGAVGDAPLPELPPVDRLDFDSDFSGFMDKRVDERLRRLALKKLFSDPRFNVTDGLDDYAEDYTLLEDLPKEMVERLQHARRTLTAGDEAKRPEDTNRRPAGEDSAPAAAAQAPAAPAEASPEEAARDEARNGDLPAAESASPDTPNGSERTS